MLAELESPGKGLDALDVDAREVGKTLIAWDAGDGCYFFTSKVSRFRIKSRIPALSGFRRFRDAFAI